MTAALFDPLYNTFEENTVLWILISLGLGGLITAIINYLFQNYLPEWQRRKATRAAVQKYSFPIIQQAANLLNMVTNLTYNRGRSIESEDLINLLYELGGLLGWFRILQNETLVETVETPSILKKHVSGMKIQFHITRLLLDISEIIRYAKDVKIESHYNLSWSPLHVPNLELGAIGDLMISHNSEHASRLIGLAEFAQRYEETSELKKWFSYFDSVFLEVRNSRANSSWNRLIMLQVSLIIFILNYVKKDRITFKGPVSGELLDVFSKLLWFPLKFLKYLKLVKLMIILLRYDSSHFAENLNRALGKKKRRERDEGEGVFEIREEIVEFENNDNLKFYLSLVKKDISDPFEYYLEHGSRDLQIMSLVNTAIFLDPIYLSEEVFNRLRSKLEHNGYLELFDEPHYKKLSLCDKMLLKDPNNATILNDKGKVYAALGSYKEASSCFNRALEIENNFIEAWINIGLLKLYPRAYPRYKDLESAIKCFEEALKLTPVIPIRRPDLDLRNHANIWNYIGVINVTLRRFDEALQCFQKALEIEPTLTLASYNKELIMTKVN